MKIVDGLRPTCTRGLGRLITAVLASLAVAGITLTVAPAQAEGSRSLYPSAHESITGAGRANLDLAGTGTVYLNIVPRRTFIYVYAQAGERILFGSRNRTANNVGGISIYQPQDFGSKGFETIPGSADFTCASGSTGLIDTRSKELAGPRAVSGGGNPNGYVPCVYVATQTGVHGVMFGVGNSGGANGTTGSLATPALSTGSVSAWDVTVRDSDTSTVDLNGRVFTYAWSSVTGGNDAGNRLYSDLYYVTSDGYRYRQSLKGMDPFAGTFFANALGFRDQGQPLYKDIRGNALTATPLPSGVTVDRPEYPIFFTDVSGSSADATLTALGIPLTPKPPQVNSFRFSYPPSGGSTSYVSQGGIFQFEVTDTISFQIVISRDGSDWDPANPLNRVLTGTSGTGVYSTVWDGRDNSGNPFPVGNYQFRITGRSGEVHFPFVDVEGNIYGGPVVTKLNGNIVDSLVYYDDRGYVTRNGTAIGTLNGPLCGNTNFQRPTPEYSLMGVDSSAEIYNNGSAPAYARWWLGSSNSNSDCSGAAQFFGDSKALNLWTYQTTQPQSNTFDILDEADVKATVSAPIATMPGSPVTVNVGFGNVGSQSASGVGYTLQLPAGLSSVSCDGATCNYDAGSGVVTVSGLPASLSPGQWVNMTLAYLAPGSGSIGVAATVSTSTSQGANLAPDTAAAVTLIGGSSDADVLTSVSPPPSAVAGGTVSVPVVYANVGALTATVSSYTLTLSPGLNDVVCSGSGVGCTYDSGSGVVSLTGLPGALASGQSVPFTVSYTAPAAASVVAVNSAIVTSSSESNTANNTASGATTTQSSGAAPDVSITVSAPVTTTPGAAVDVAVAFGNVGSVPAGGVGYTLQLPTGLPSVSCLPPVNCVYNSGTGAVTVAGLPATLAGGDWASLTLRYTAPAAGVVPITATVSTTTPGEINPANNTASGHTTVITAATGADVSVTLAPPVQAAPGSTVNVPVTVVNLGPSPANGVTYTLTLPANLTGVSCSASGVTCSYDADSGVVTLSGLPSTLASGQSVPFTLTYTAPGSGSVAVNATIASTTSDPNSGNNAATGTTLIASGTADVTTTVSPPPSAVAGTTVNVPVSFRNAGANAAAGVTYTVTLSGSPSGVTVSNGATPCTYNAGTGAINAASCGLPATLSPGQTVNLMVAYTAPDTGPVSVTSLVGTSSSESNTGNNSATAATVITAAAAPDMSINLGGLPTTAVAGSPYSGTFSCSNVGTAAATANTSCSVTGLPGTVAVQACTISPSAAPWSAGAPIPVGQTVTCSVSGNPGGAGNVSMSGTTGATGDANTSNNTAVLGVSISVPSAEMRSIPTLSEWGLIVLSGLLALFGFGYLNRRRGLDF